MKPYVICHMCNTIDGRILGERWPKLPGGQDSAELFESTADSFGIGAWIVGTNTMREFAGRNVKLKRARRPVERADHVVLLVSSRVSDDYLSHLQDAGVSYLFCGKDRVEVKVALDKIRRILGIRRLMLEGGGTFNGAVLQAGLVDEISQVVVPVVDGGRGVPTIFDIPGDLPRKAAAALRLKSYRRLPGGVGWFRYRVARRSAREAAQNW